MLSTSWIKLFFIAFLFSHLHGTNKLIQIKIVGRISRGDIRFELMPSIAATTMYMLLTELGQSIFLSSIYNSDVLRFVLITLGF